MLSPSTSNVVLSLPNPKQLEDRRFSLDELIEKLMGLLTEGSQRNEILQLTGDTAVLVIECLDQVLSSGAFRSILGSQARSNMLATISRLSRNVQYLPRSYWIDPNTITLPKDPCTAGTCAEVYMGTHAGQAAAVKVLRTSNQESAIELKKRFCREVVVWKHMSCPYILKLNGVFCHNEVPAIVTPWIPHGNIIEYLEKNPNIDRLRLFLGVVKGVRYLHSCNIAHGDIKGPNILISDSDPPRAMLADFGFTRVTSPDVEMSSEECGTVPFMAPELLHSTMFGLEKGVPSKEADVYALGMTVYQVLTGQRPFYPKREVEVVHAVISGERPPKPKDAERIGMTEIVWELVRMCWREDRTKRPDISRIVRRFRKITGEGRTAGPAIEVAIPRLDVSGGRISVVPEDPSSAIVSSLHSDTEGESFLSVATTLPSSPFHCFGSEEMTEAKEKNPIEGGKATKNSRSAARTNHLTKENLKVNRAGTWGASVVSGPPSPTELPGCCMITGAHTRKGRYVWNQVKQFIAYPRLSDSVGWRLND